MKFRNLIIGATVLVAALTLMPSQSLAVQINYGGQYILEDLDTAIGPVGFRENISFGHVTVDTWSPTTDSTFCDIGDTCSGFVDNASTETIVLSTLTLSGSSYVSGDYFDFDPTSYSDGFKIIDGDGSTTLLTADLAVNRLVIDGSTGTVNSIFTMNLTGITTAPGILTSNSLILTAFANAPGAAMNITLQTSGDLSGLILSGTSRSSTSALTFSGSAAPVPEPSTILLLGGGLLGLALARRKKTQV